MTNHASISPEEAANRLAISELVDAYAHCADTRDALGQMDLFTERTDSGTLIRGVYLAYHSKETIAEFS